MQRFIANRRSQVLLVLLIIDVIFIIFAFATQLFFKLGLDHYQAETVIAIVCAAFGAISAIVGIGAIVQSLRGKKQYSWLLGLVVFLSGAGVTVLFMLGLLWLIVSYGCKYQGQCV